MRLAEKGAAGSNGVIVAALSTASRQYANACFGPTAPVV
jgi:hypothetical protein